MINRCAECKLLGGLPNCPKCKRGKLHMNKKTGEYKCSGYMGSDENHYNCVYKTHACDRLKWIE